MANWAWPEIVDTDSAREAAHRAGGWAGVVGGLTAVFALISLAGGTAVLGAAPWSLIDAALYGVLAWRIWSGSRAWAVAGLSLYCISILYAVITHPPGISVLTIIILLNLVNGVRGTFALHRFTESRMQRQAMAAQGAAYQAMQLSMPTTSVPPPPPPDSGTAR